MVSAVYIVKNEAQNIIRSLNSVKDIANEIIVVDTGSTDNTIELVKAWGNCKVYEYPFTDFADCRNYALSKATGEWNVVIDADETLESDISKLVEEKSIDAWAVVQLDKGGQMCQTFRILRKGISYKYSVPEDRIHEIPDLENKRTGLSDVVFRHHKSLTDEQHKAKMESIMSYFGDIDEGVKKDYYEGVYNLGIGNSVKGIECFNRCIDKVSPQLRAFIRMFVGSYYSKLSDLYSVEAFYFLNKCIEDTPEQNEGYMKLAEYYINRREFNEALGCIEKVKARTNRLLTNLQNDKFYTNEQIELRINQIKEMQNGFNNN